MTKSNRAIMMTGTDYDYLGGLTIIVYDDAKETYLCEHCLGKTLAGNMGLSDRLIDMKDRMRNCEGMLCHHNAKYVVELSHLTGLQLVRRNELRKCQLKNLMKNTPSLTG